MPASLLNFEAITVLLNEYVLPKLNKNFEQSFAFWKRLKKGETLETNSRGARIMNYLNPNPSMKDMDYNGGLFPVAGSPEYGDMRVYWAAKAISSGFTYATFLQKDAKAAYNFIFNQLDQDRQTISKEIEKDCWESGDGRKAVVASVNGTTITFAAPFGATRILKGGYYNFYSQGGTKRTGGGNTNCVAKTPGTRLSGNYTFDVVPNNIQVGDILTWVDSFGRGIHGVPYHVNTGSGNYQGLSRGDYPDQLKPTEYDLQFKKLSVNAIDFAIYQNKFKMGTEEEAKSFELWSSPTQAYRYNSIGYNLLRSEVGKTSQFNGTYTEAPKHGLCEWNMAVDCPDDRVYGLTMDTLAIYMLEELGVIDPDGETMRLIPGFDTTGSGSYKAALQVLMGCAFDIGSPDPRKNILISNVDYSGLPNRMAA